MFLPLGRGWDLSSYKNVEIYFYSVVKPYSSIDIYYDSTSGRKLGASRTYTTNNLGYQRITFKVNDAQFDGTEDIVVETTGDSPKLNSVNVYRNVSPSMPPSDPTVGFNKASSDLVLTEGYANLYLEAQALDIDGSIAQVDLYLNDEMIRRDDSFPFEWDETSDPMLLGLPAGIHELKLVAVDDEGNSTEVVTDLKVIPTHRLIPAPARIEAEDYDTGLAGITYSDTTPSNAFGHYRNDDVDVDICNDIGGGYHVGNTASGERLDYTIQVPLAGSYQIAFRYAADGDRRCHAKIGSTNLTGTVTLTGTGGLNQWNTVSAQAELPAGRHALSLVFGEPDDVPMNLNWIQIRPTRTTGFQIWKQQHDMPDTDGTSGDRDGDGRSNEYEYLFGLNPTNATSSQAVQIMQTGTKPIYRYTERTDVAITYSVMISTNLVDWDVEEGVIEINTIDNGDGTSTHEIEISLNSEVYETGFVKIIAEE